MVFCVPWYFRTVELVMESLVHFARLIDLVAPRMNGGKAGVGDTDTLFGRLRGVGLFALFVLLSLALAPRAAAQSANTTTTLTGVTQSSSVPTVICPGSTCGQAVVATASRQT